MTASRLVLGIGLLLGSLVHAGPPVWTKASDKFAFKYEMDVNPSEQNLDQMGSASDWFAGPKGLSDNYGMPLTYVQGVAYSRQSPPDGYPELLFRTDFRGSVQRTSLTGDFTIEVSVILLGEIEEGDVGGFNVAIDPGGDASSFRMNVGHRNVSLNYGGDSVVETGDNTDRLHVFRIAYNAKSDRYWAWRDGRLVYGGNRHTGVRGPNPPFNGLGSILVGDSTDSISGEWALDYIRLDPSAAAPNGPQRPAFKWRPAIDPGAVKKILRKDVTIKVLPVKELQGGCTLGSP